MAQILIAEDDEAVRLFVKRALEMKGHTVSVAADGGEALDRLRDTPVDLLLTDIVMPVMDGIALSLKASELYPDLKIIMMTGYSAERQRAHNLESLIAEVLPKPFSLDELAQMVERHL